MWESTGGIGPPCGNGVLGLAGRIGCSGTHIDSKPKASAVRQKSAGLAVSSVNGISSPTFMLHLLRLLYERGDGASPLRVDFSQKLALISSQGICSPNAY